MNEQRWAMRMLPLFLTVATVGGALALAFS
jgi:hypothetical protein